MVEILETMSDYNTKHPEQKSGEVFHTNADREGLRQNPQWYSEPYRIGKTAYTIYGSEIKNCVPVFRKRG